MNFAAWGSLKRSLTTVAGVNSGAVSGVANLSVGDAVNSTLVPPGTTVLTSSGVTVTFAFAIQTWQCSLLNSAVIRFPGNVVPAGLNLATLVGAAVSDPNGYFPAGVTVLAVGADGVSLQTSAAPTTIPTTTTPAPIEFAPTANAVLGGTDANAIFDGVATPFGASTITFQLERSFDGGYTWICCNIGGSGQPAQFANPTAPVSVAYGDPEAGMLYRINCLAFASAVTGTTCNYRLSTTGQAGIVASTPAIM